MLEVPDFGHVPARFPSLTDSLIRSRCRVVGSLDRPLARGRLMFGPQRILLRQWPPENQPLLEFEQSTSELDYLLNAECLLRPGPTWLFKVASDGLAYELRAAHVRADNKYVLLSEAAPKALAPPFCNGCGCAVRKRLRGPTRSPLCTHTRVGARTGLARCSEGGDRRDLAGWPHAGSVGWRRQC